MVAVWLWVACHEKIACTSEVVPSLLLYIISLSGHLEQWGTLMDDQQISSSTCELCACFGDLIWKSRMCGCCYMWPKTANTSKKLPHGSLLWQKWSWLHGASSLWWVVAYHLTTWAGKFHGLALSQQPHLLPYAVKYCLHRHLLCSRLIMLHRPSSISYQWDLPYYLSYTIKIKPLSV